MSPLVSVNSGVPGVFRRVLRAARLAVAFPALLTLAAPAHSQDDIAALAMRLQALQIELTNRISSMEQSLRFVTDLVERSQRDQRQASAEIRDLVNDLRRQVSELRAGIPAGAGTAADESVARAEPESAEGQLGVLIRPVTEPGGAEVEGVDSSAEQERAERVQALLDSLDGIGAEEVTVDQQFDEALDLLRDGFLSDAATKFEGFVESNPDDPRVADAWYWIGEARLGMNRLQAAAEAHLTVVQSYAESPKAPDSLLRVGMTFARQGNDRQACDAFRLVGQLYPDAGERLKARVETEMRDAGCGS